MKYAIEVFDCQAGLTSNYEASSSDIDEFLVALCERYPFSRVEIMTEADTIPFVFRVDFGAIKPPRYEGDIALDEYLKGYGYPYGYR